MSIEEARELTDTVQCEEDCRQLVNTIYDSIGTCGECEYYDEKSIDTDNVCIIQGILHSQAWYCADFERKKDEH